MSNEIYPVLPGLQLPVQRIIVPPKVDVRTSLSGRERRARDGVLDREQFGLTYEFLRTGRRGSELASLLGFYRRHGGPFDSWLFDDVEDNTAVASTFGVGDGATASFQLVRNAWGFVSPVSDLTLYPAVFVDGAAVNLVPNGSFEDNPSTVVATGWGGYNFGSLGTVTYSQTAWSVDGGVGQFAGCTAMAAGAGNTLGVYRQDLAGPYSGQAFALGASFLVTAGRRINLYVDWYSAAGGFLGGYNETATSTGAPVRLWFTQTAPVNAAKASLYLYADQGNGGAVDFRVDAVQMQVGAGPESYSPYVMNLGGSGLVNFASPLPAGKALTWSGNFRKRCRFLGDKLDLERFTEDMYAAKKVEFITLKPGDR